MNLDPQTIIIAGVAGFLVVMFINYFKTLIANMKASEEEKTKKMDSGFSDDYHNNLVQIIKSMQEIKDRLKYEVPEYVPDEYKGEYLFHDEIYDREEMLDELRNIS